MKARNVYISLYRAITNRFINRKKYYNIERPLLGWTDTVYYCGREFNLECICCKNNNTIRIYKWKMIGSSYNGKLIIQRDIKLNLRWEILNITCYAGKQYIGKCDTSNLKNFLYKNETMRVLVK